MQCNSWNGFAWKTATPFLTYQALTTKNTSSLAYWWWMPWQSLTYHIKGDTGSIHTGKFRAGDSSVPITRGLWRDSFIWTEQHFKKYHQTTEITSVIIKCVNIRTKDLISLQISFPYFFPSLSMHPCLPSSHSSFHLTFLSYPHSSILSTFYKVFCSSLLHIFTSSIHTPPFYLPYFLRTHHTPTHRRPVDSLEHRCTLATCSHRCGCHTRSCLDKEVSI